MIIPRRCLRLIYEEAVKDPYLIKRVPQNSIKCFLDIGASYGLVSIHAKLNHTNMKVGCVEPHDESYQALKQNVENLGIYTLNAALGDGNIFTLWHDRKTPLCNTYGIFENPDGGKTIQSYPLDGLVKKLRLGPEDLWIKMDCEGAEIYLNKSKKSKEILKQTKILTMELHQKEGLTPVDSFINELTDLLKETHIINIKPVSRHIRYGHIIRKDIYGGWYET